MSEVKRSRIPDIKLKEICNDILGPIQVETLAHYPGHTTKTLMQDIYLAMEEGIDQAIERVFTISKITEIAQEVKNSVKKPKT